jgi:pimeloyl-ACP methyl ester carboxylesterase
MLPLAQAVAAAGLRPVLLELPAHGRSAGTMSNSPQFARAIAYVAARLAADGHALRAAVAHSLGANGLALAAARGLPAERLVLLAPPASPREYTRYFAHTFGLSEATRLAMQRRLESREGVLMAQLEPAAVGPRIAQPTLIVHDREDRVNRFADAEAYRDAIGSARLVATQGWGHRRILKEAAVLAHVAGFVTSPAS